MHFFSFLRSSSVLPAPQPFSRLSRLLFLQSLLMTVLAATARAQPVAERFEWISPRFSLQPLSAPRHINGDTVAVYASGFVLRSTDRGAGWQRLEGDPATDTLRMQARWFDREHGWGVLYGPLFYLSDTIAYRTSDGGATWQFLTLPMKVRQFGPVNRDSAFAIDSEGRLFRTDDGGAVWSLLSIGSGVMAQRLWTHSPHRLLLAAGDAGGTSLFLSTDDGNTWNRSSFTSASGTTQTMPELADLTFADTLVGLAWGANNLLYRTVDGGAVWTYAGSAVERAKRDSAILPELLSITMASRERGWARGYFDEIYATADGGTTWSVQDTGSAPAYTVIAGNTVVVRRPKLHALFALDEEHAIATGVEGNLVVTVNGVVWQSMNPPAINEYLTSASFPTTEIGWVGGIKGGVLRTADGGMTWQRQRQGDTAPVVALAATDPLNAWIVGAKGVYRTSDGGEHWQFVPVTGFPVDSSVAQGMVFYSGIRALSMVDRNCGWVAGVRGAVHRTVDGGLHWSPCSPLPGAAPLLHAVCFVDTATGWVVGEEGAVFRTDDGGESWQPQVTGDTVIAMTSQLQPLYDVSFLDHEHGVVGGAAGRIFVTADGGTTWTRGTGEGIRRDYLFTSVRYLAPGDLRCGGLFNTGFGPVGVVGRSVEGRDWGLPATVFPGTIGPVNDIAFANANCGMLVGKDGAILRYTRAVQAAVPSPVHTESTVRILPNPAADRVQVEMPPHQRALVQVVDLRGTVVAVGHSSNAPRYSSVPVDLSACPAGTYRLTVQVDGVIVNGSIVVVR